MRKGKYEIVWKYYERALPICEMPINLKIKWNIIYFPNILYIVCWPLMKADVNSSLILHNCFQKFCFWNLIWCSFPMVKEWFIYLMIILLLLTKIFKIIFTSSYFFNFNIFYTGWRGPTIDCRKPTQFESVFFLKIFFASNGKNN